MKRRDFMKWAGGMTAAVALPRLTSGHALTKEKPCIVLILIDDLGWSDLSCYGSKYYESPNIDRLAAQGMRFTNAYAACSVCSPTRASIMTGRYPAGIGVTDWIRQPWQDPQFNRPPSEECRLHCPENLSHLKLEEVTVAEVLRKAGYVTCHIGKWHLGQEDYFPEKQGFDINIGGCGLGWPPDYFDPYANAQVSGIPTLASRKKGEYLTDRLTDEAVKFLKNHEDRPFFLYLSHYAVHEPIQAKQELLKRWWTKEPSPTQQNNVYAAMIQSVDMGTKRVLDILEEINIADKTLVIFTSDNGGQTGITSNWPLRWGKGTPYEGGVRVPLIVRWPGHVLPGSKSQTPVTSTDYFPTILEAAGVDLPTGLIFDGESLFSLLAQKGDLKRDSIYWHYPHYNSYRLGPYTSMRSGDWKMIKWYDSESFELFNLKNDLSETTNLAKTNPEQVRSMNLKIEEWIGCLGIELPQPNPRFNPSGRRVSK